jgi:hypothetical protein
MKSKLQRLAEGLGILGKYVAGADIEGIRCGDVIGPRLTQAQVFEVSESDRTALWDLGWRLDAGNFWFMKVDG